MRDRRQVIEFASIVIFMTVLGAVARSALPEVHQLLRFVLIVLVTVRGLVRPGAPCCGASSSNP